MTKPHPNCYACSTRDYGTDCTCAAEWRKQTCKCGHAVGSHDYGVHQCTVYARKAQRIGTVEAVNGACYRFAPSGPADAETVELCTCPNPWMHRPGCSAADVRS
jgi:hypothetical protein